MNQISANPTFFPRRLSVIIQQQQQQQQVVQAQKSLTDPDCPPWPRLHMANVFLHNNRRRKGNMDWRKHVKQNPTFLSRRLSVIISVFWQSPCLPSTPLMKKWGFGKNLTPRASRHKRTPSAMARPRARTRLVQTEGPTKERQQGLEKT